MEEVAGKGKQKVRVDDSLVMRKRPACTCGAEGNTPFSYASGTPSRLYQVYSDAGKNHQHTVTIIVHHVLGPA